MSAIGNNSTNNKNSPNHSHKRGLFGRVIEDIVLLFSLIKDFVRGRYRRVPVWSLVILTGAFLYVIFPFDFIPDYIPGYGQIDDAVVALLCLFFLEKDLYAYKLWKEQNS
ncbi:MAG: YkvA family protein [Elusimicrobiota bacterium]